MCYQLPAIISEGTAIIISPLIALMKNQVDNIRNFGQDKGIAHVMNSSLSKTELAEVREDLMAGVTKLLYVAPESLTKEDNVEFLKKIKISFYAIDEAHCISEWGHDFRPEYRRIRPIINAIGQKVPVIALTATATPKVQQDIRKNLDMNDAVLYKSSFNRKNLYYEVRPKTKDVVKDIIRFIKENPNKSGIVYCLSRKKVEELAETLVVNGIKALPYHAGLDSATRKGNQDKFLMEEVDVIVATIAFGMGIDKPDVRFVIHHDIPKSLEGYYQETGRAGRDDGEGKCITFYSYDDIVKLEKFMKNKGVAEQEIAKQLLQETVAYAESAICRRKQLLHYFGEDYHVENCHSCDNCLHPKKQFDGKDAVKLVLETVLEAKELFKPNHIINILIGKNTASLKSYKHEHLKVFGMGCDHSDKHWNAVIRQCLILGLLEKDIEMYGTLLVPEKGREFLQQPYSVMLTEDHDYEAESDNTSAEQGVRSGASDKNLIRMLKDLRKDISKKENLPPFVIFQDPSLEDMAIQYPISEEELTNITGVGAGKAKKYGEPFIKLIKTYVEENDIIRAHDMVVKSVVNKSGLKVYIIRSIDRKLSLEDIAKAKSLSVEELLGEIERIVESGTRLDLSYYVDELVDPDNQLDILDYYSEVDVRLMRIKYLSDVGN